MLRQNSGSYRSWGRHPSEGGAKGLRLDWELSSGTCRALFSQSALVGVPRLLLITNCSVIFSHYHGDGRPSILSSRRMQLDLLSPGLCRVPLLCLPCLLSCLCTIHSLLHPFIHSFLPHTPSLHSFTCSFIHSFLHSHTPSFLLHHPLTSTAPGSPQIGNDGQRLTKHPECQMRPLV